MQGVVEFVRALGAARIAAMAAVTVALIGFFAFVIMRATAPTMAPLFTDLSLEDSSGIVKELAEIVPQGEKLFEDDALSDKPVRFFVAEFVREQILKKTFHEALDDDGDVHLERKPLPRMRDELISLFEHTELSKYLTEDELSQFAVAAQSKTEAK